MDFRGAVVEDWQLPPPLPVYTDMLLEDALDLVMEQYPWVPKIVGVLDRFTHRLTGYLDGRVLEPGEDNNDARVVALHMHRLADPPQITISAPLETLTALLQTEPVVEVTDAEHKYALAVVTAEDAERRGVRIECH